MSGKCYLCESETLNERSMSLPFRSLPVLTEKSAERFLREVERVNRLPRRVRPVDYYDYIDRLLEKSKKFVREHEGLGFRLDSREIQAVLTKYFQNRLDAKSDELWDNGILDQKRLDEIRHENLHKK